jgi:hypothetical protein
MQLRTPRRRQAAASAAGRSSSHSWHEWGCPTPLLQLLLLWCSAAALLAGRCHAAEEATPMTVQLSACAGKPSCAMLTTDGTVATMPPLFLQAITNSSMDEIVVTGDRYVLRPSAWAHLSQQAPYVISRNITIHGASTTVSGEQVGCVRVARPAPAAAAAASRGCIGQRCSPPPLTHYPCCPSRAHARTRAELVCD